MRRARTGAVGKLGAMAHGGEVLRICARRVRETCPGTSVRWGSTQSSLATPRCAEVRQAPAVFADDGEGRGRSVCLFVFGRLQMMAAVERLPAQAYSRTGEPTSHRSSWPPFLLALRKQGRVHICLLMSEHFIGSSPRGGGGQAYTRHR